MKSIDIGRETSCSLRVPEHYSGVGRVHARVHIHDNGHMEIMDLGSRLGTWVDGHQIPSQQAVPFTWQSEVWLHKYRLDMAELQRASIQPEPAPIAQPAPVRPAGRPKRCMRCGHVAVPAGMHCTFCHTEMTP